jgi:hypothetical protein
MFHPQRHYLTVTLTLTLLKKERLHTVEDCTCIWTEVIVDVVLESETTTYHTTPSLHDTRGCQQSSSTSPEACGEP